MKSNNLMNYILALCSFIFSSSFDCIIYADTNEVNIHGFISQGYLKSNHNNYYANTEDGTFQFNEMGINFTTNVTDKLHLGIQFFAKDLGRLGNDELKISWAYSDYRFRDFLGLRAGLMKIPLGFHNEIRDMDVLRPNILYPNGMYNESWREILSSIKGLGLYGNFGLGKLGKIKYIVQSGVPTVRHNQGSTDLLEDRVPLYIPSFRADIQSITVKPLYTYSVTLISPLTIKGLKIKSSGILAEYDNLTTLSPLPGEHVLTLTPEFHAVSLEFTRGNYTITSEYMHLNFEIALEGYDLNLINITLTEPVFTALAYYTSFAYAITDWLEIYICYSNFFDDKDDRSGHNLEGIDHKYRRWYEEYILALRFDINSNWIFKVETHINNGTAVLLNADQGEPEPPSSLGAPLYPYKKDWVLFAMKLSYNF